MRDTLDVNYVRARRMYPDVPVEQLEQSLILDVSQCVSREKPHSEEEWLALTTMSMIYSYGQDKLYSGHDNLRCMGWPVSHIPPVMSDAECRDLAGDSFSVPIGMTLTAGCYIIPFAQWWQ